MDRSGIKSKATNVTIIITMTEESGTMDIAVTMTMVLGTMVGILGGLAALQTRQKKTSNDDEESWLSGFLPSSSSQPSKRAYECWVLTYTPMWILAFGVIVAFQLYEDFDEWSYMTVCGGLSLPFLLQPVLLPSCGYGSPDQKRPLLQRYCFKANVWLAVYSFIGNYWYTHCRCNTLLEHLCLGGMYGLCSLFMFLIPMRLSPCVFDTPLS
jgi:hypothetical protein